MRAGQRLARRSRLVSVAVAVSWSLRTARYLSPLNVLALLGLAFEPFRSLLALAAFAFTATVACRARCRCGAGCISRRYPRSLLADAARRPVCGARGGPSTAALDALR